MWMCSHKVTTTAASLLISNSGQVRVFARRGTFECMNVFAPCWVMGNGLVCVTVVQYSTQVCPQIFVCIKWCFCLYCGWISAKVFFSLYRKFGERPQPQRLTRYVYHLHMLITNKQAEKGLSLVRPTFLHAQFVNYMTYSDKSGTICTWVFTLKQKFVIFKGQCCSYCLTVNCFTIYGEKL